MVTIVATIRGKGYEVLIKKLIGEQEYADINNCIFF